MRVANGGGRNRYPLAMRKKVVLYNPRCVFWTMPLALIAVGSALDATKYEVVIVDGRLERDPLGALRRHLDDRTVCFGVTVLTGAPIRDALAATRLARGLMPELPIVWGGWHPSLFPTECLEEPGVTAVVTAQGEETFVELVERFAKGEGPQGVAGSTSRLGGRAVAGPKREMKDLNDLPPLRYELSEVERYFEAKGRRQLDYISSQGCRFRCSFCADPFVYERGWSGIAPERMGEELESLWKRHRFDDLNLQDETYFTHRKRVMGISEQILNRGLKFSWAATMRADQGNRLTDDEWALVKRSGLRRVMVGVESGSQEMMDWLQKDVKLEQVFATAEKMIRHGITGIFPFIVGFPDETDESVEATIQVIKQLRAMSSTFQISVYFYQPYPGSPIADLAWKRGYKQPTSLEEWSNFDYVGSRGPWVTQEKWERIQRFKFFQKIAYSPEPSKLTRPVRWLARKRLEHDYYGNPLEMRVTELLRPGEKLS